MDPEKGLGHDGDIKLEKPELTPESRTSAENFAPIDEGRQDGLEPKETPAQQQYHRLRRIQYQAQPQ